MHSSKNIRTRQKIKPGQRRPNTGGRRTIRYPRQPRGILPVKTIFFSILACFALGIHLILQSPEKSDAPSVDTVPTPHEAETKPAPPQAPTDVEPATPQEITFNIPDQPPPERPNVDLLKEMSNSPIWTLGAWDFNSEDGLELDSRTQHVLDIGRIEPGNYLLKLVLTPDSRHEVDGGYPWIYSFPPDEPAASPLRLGEFLTLELNGCRVYSLWRAGHEYIVSVLLPATALTSSDNRLLIHNNSSDHLGIDCAWIEEVSAGEQVSVVLDGASWIQRPKIARDIASIGFRLDPQLLSEPVALPETMPQNHPLFTTSRLMTLDERRQIWNDCFGAAPPDGAGRKQQAFHNELHRILSLDAEPHLSLCSVKTINQQSIDPLLSLYAPFIESWELIPDTHTIASRDNRQTPDTILIDGIRKHSPGAMICCRKPPDSNRVRHDMPIAISWNYPGEFLRALEHQNNLRLRAAEAGFLPTMMNHPAIGTDLGLLGSGSLQEQLRNGLVIPEFAAGSMDEGTSRVVIGGLRGGANVFIWGDRAPGLAWEAIRLVSRFGRDHGRRWPVGLVPVAGDWGLAHARWVAALGEDERIQILLFAGADGGRELKLSVPVTRPEQDYIVTFEGVEIVPDESITPRPIARTRITPEKTGGQSADGTLNITCKPSPLTLVTVQPESVSESAKNIASVPVLYSPKHLSFSRTLFQTPRTPKLQGYWVAELWPESPAIESLDPDTKIEGDVPATPGVVADIPNIVPWRKTSAKATLHAPQDGSRPCGAMVRLSKTYHRTPETLEFWVRATSSRGLSQVPFRAGGRYAGGEILIPTNEWVCIQCDWDRLFKLQGNGLPSFYLYPTPEHPAYTGRSTVTYEINGPISKSKKPPENLSMACRLITDTDNRRNQPSETPVRAFVFARPDTAFRLAKRFASAPFTGPVAASCDGVVCEYRPESQVLLVHAERTPQLSEFDPDQWSAPAPVKYQQACRQHGLFPIEITQRIDDTEPN
jgi:hypothetical protein